MCAFVSKYTCGLRVQYMGQGIRAKAKTHDFDDDDDDNDDTVSNQLY